MYPRRPHSVHRLETRTQFAAVGMLAVGLAVAAALAGCASESPQRSTGSPAHAAPYVGEFTGEFVDGKPLYRFPPIEVIGSRSSLGPGT